jgi:RNA polymerase sigma-70 factor (ECF subfamily)
MGANKAGPAGPETDERLVARVRAGDVSAVERLVERHVDTAFAVALAVVGDRDEAEDVCQDAMVRALERIAECRQPARFGAWLAEITRNRAHSMRDYRRVRAALPIAENSALARGVASDAVERAELRRRLEIALDALSETQRLVVLLHDLQGYPHVEIADLLGISETGSRQYLFVARKHLRAHLGTTLMEDYLRE